MEIVVSNDSAGDRLAKAREMYRNHLRALLEDAKARKAVIEEEIRGYEREIAGITGVSRLKPSQVAINALTEEGHHMSVGQLVKRIVASGAMDHIQKGEAQKIIEAKKALKQSLHNGTLTCDRPVPERNTVLGDDYIIGLPEWK